MIIITINNYLGTPNVENVQSVITNKVSNLQTQAAQNLESIISEGGFTFRFLHLSSQDGDVCTIGRATRSNLHC